MQFTSSFVVVAATLFGLTVAAPVASGAEGQFQQLDSRAAASSSVQCRNVSPSNYVLKINADCEACRHNPKYPAFTDKRDNAGHRILVTNLHPNDNTVPAGPEEFIFEACDSHYMNLPGQNGTTYAGHIKSSRATNYCLTLSGESTNGRFTSQPCSYTDDISQENQFFVWDRTGNAGTENYLGVVPQPSQDGQLTQSIAEDRYIHNALQLFIGSTEQEKVGWRTSTTTQPFQTTSYLRLADPSIN